MLHKLAQNIFVPYDDFTAAAAVGQLRVCEQLMQDFLLGRNTQPFSADKEPFSRAGIPGSISHVNTHMLVSAEKADATIRMNT